MNRSAGKIKPYNESSEDMRPEYDFSGGERGRHSHLFGEVADDEASVAAFWQDRGFDPQRFDKLEIRFSKAPDFKIYREGNLIAFCEVKTFQHDTWLDQALEKAMPGESAGGLRPNPVYNRISNAVHTAVRQLESVNPQHEHLNFLALVNRDKASKREDLVSVLTGYWDPLQGMFEKTHMPHSEGRIREDKRKIDLYLWMEPSPDGALTCKSFFFGNDKTRDETCNLLGLDPDAVKIIR